MRRPYVGRFAPTPTGPLHFGSLLTAVASYLDARANDGTWHLRIDDLDTPRVIAGAESAILRTLERHGLLWDGPIVRQRERSAAYTAALASPGLSERCFYCTCSRKSLAGQTTYPGTCRAIRADPGGAAIRIQAPRGEIAFEDLIQGRYAEQLAETTGDFVVYRRDAITAYQLAVVVDDDAIGVTRVVRGADLLDNTPRQLYLIERLELATPGYAHIPVITEASGAKLACALTVNLTLPRTVMERSTTVVQPGRPLAL